MLSTPWFLRRRDASRSRRSGGRAKRSGGDRLASRRLRVQGLEDRRLLSIDGWMDEKLPVADPNKIMEAQPARADLPPFVAGEILIGFEGDVPAVYRAKGAAAALEAADRLVGPHGLRSPQVLMEAPARGNQAARLATRWQLPAEADVLAMVQRLTGRPGIAYAEPNWLVSIDTTPNDPRFGQLWGLHNTGQTGGTADGDIDAPEAWGIATGSRSIVVGVIDTGVDYTHPDLAANIWTNPREFAGNNGVDDDGNGYVDDVYGWDFYNNDNNPFDDHGHGTHVSGTIGAVGNNGQGVVGVNWNVQIMGLKFLGADGSGPTSAAVQAVQYATWMRTHGVNIVLTNNSWGGGSYSQALYDAIADSGQANMLFVAAAGNSNSSTPLYPAGYDLDNIISVAATDHNDAKASFSNYGADWVDLGAPGVDILSTTPANNYGLASGTSMAAPHVAGVAALAWSTAPTATAAFIKGAILEGVDRIASLSGITVTGGRLNAYGTLQRTGMTVRQSSPAAGQILSPDAPTIFVVDFSFPYDDTTVQATDLTVNGIAANSVTQTDADTLTFTYLTSPVTVEGIQTMHMAAGTVKTASPIPHNKDLIEWTATFRWDAVRMQVVSTDPQNGSTVTLPFDTLWVTLNEPYHSTTVGIDDLALNQGRVVGAVSVDAQTIKYTLADVTQEGTLYVVMPAGSLTDNYGNPMGAYHGSLELDFGTVPLPASLKAVHPRGSLVYRTTVTGAVRNADDTDGFLLDLAGGQTITLVLDPDSGLQPVVEVFGPSGASLGRVSAPAGVDAVLQTVPVNIAGNYRVMVGGLAGSTGSYALGVVLNAAVEVESHSGATNDTRGGAEDLGGAFLDLGDLGGGRAAVIGRADGFDVARAVTKTYTYAKKVRIPDQGKITSTLTVGDSYSIADLDVRLDISHTRDMDLDAFLIGPDGTRVQLFMRRGGGGDNFTNTVLDDEADVKIIDGVAPFTGRYRPEGRLSDFDGKNVKGTWTLEVSDTSKYDTGSLNSWSIEVTQAPTRPDYYRLALVAADQVTLALTKLTTGRCRVELQDDSGNVLANGSSGPANVHAAIERFTAQRSGTYYAVVTGDPGLEYQLLVVRAAAFDLEPNNDFATAQNAGLQKIQILGALATPDQVFVSPGSGGLKTSQDLLFGPDGSLYVTDFSGGIVHGTGEFMLRYDGVTGQFMDAFATGRVAYSAGMTIGPDKNFYVSDRDKYVNRFNGRTGAYIGPFISGLSFPQTPIFGPDGNLYVTNSGADSVSRYNGTTGALIDVFVPTGSGGLDYPYGLAFGPDANNDGKPELVVASRATHNILRYDGATGAFLGALVPAGSGGLSWPTMIVFGPDASGDGISDLYVACSIGVLRYNGATGAFIDQVVADTRAAALRFGPDGSLYVAHSNSVRVFCTPLVDRYRLELPGGYQVTVTTSTPLGALNSLDPQIVLYDAAGSAVASADNSAPDGRNARLTYVVPSGAQGAYYIEVAPSTATAVPTGGEYVLTIDGGPVPPPPGIVVSKSSITTTEAGGTDSFVIVLNTDPGADVTVTVPLSSSNPLEGTIQPNQVVFTGGTAGNWSTPQTVTVTGVDDFVDDGDIAYAIGIGPATASDNGSPYHGMDPADVAAANVDDDTAGIVLSTTSIVTTEGDGTKTFTVMLSSQPLAGVTINVSSSDTSEGSVNPASLTFGPDNWNTPQAVTVTGVDDAVDDGNVQYLVTLSASSNGPDYQGLSQTVAATNIDNDDTTLRLRLIDDFEDGNLAEYTGDVARTSATFGAARDGMFGLEGRRMEGWLRRTDAQAQVKRGHIISVWVRSEGTATGQGEFGFGVKTTGKPTTQGWYSIAMAPDTNRLLLVRYLNASNYTNIGAVPQAWEANKWYRMEVEWKTTGQIIGRLYDSDGTTLLNTVSATDTTFTAGGIAFRAFSSNVHFDTVELRSGLPSGASSAAELSHGVLADLALSRSVGADSLALASGTAADHAALAGAALAQLAAADEFFELGHTPRKNKRQELGLDWVDIDLLLQV